jgi:hypothetical protein
MANQWQSMGNQWAINGQSMAINGQSMAINGNQCEAGGIDVGVFNKFRPSRLAPTELQNQFGAIGGSFFVADWYSRLSAAHG